MWEACWANYQTDYFHLFLCLSIVAVYADDVIAQDLNTDEMLLHFSSLGKFYFLNICLVLIDLGKAFSQINVNFKDKCFFCSLGTRSLTCGIFTFGYGIVTNKHFMVLKANYISLHLQFLLSAHFFLILAYVCYQQIGPAV